MSGVYIVEDDKHIRELVIYALKQSGFETAGFESGKEFYARLQKDLTPPAENSAADGETNSLPELILLDIMLPGEDGLSILKNLRGKQATARIPVIMLTAKSGEYDKVQGLDLGADDYITKPFSVLELMSRVKAVLRRTRAADGERLSQSGVELDVLKRVVKVDGEEIKLTHKEFHLLHYLMKNKGIVLSRDRLIEKVWGFEFDVESRVVDMHIKALRKKLLNYSVLIETVRGFGYKFRNE